MLGLPPDTVASIATAVPLHTVAEAGVTESEGAGDEITVITNDASLNTSSVMVSKAEKAVQSIRAMLRDKKK